MKYTVSSLLALSLFGCSLSVQPPPVAKQNNDLFDADSDGVINQRDRCADTPLNSVINNDGCPHYITKKHSDDLHILFANDSVKVASQYQQKITSMKDFLNKYPTVHLELKGYASPTGNSDYNKQLSLHRANVVRNILISEGINPSRIKSVGFGDSDPITASNTEESNLLSRRVIARAISVQKDVVKQWTIYSVLKN